jgi:hypothetical protein
MASSDIYEIKDPPWLKKPEPPRRRRRSAHQKTFDETVNPDLAHTHRRRSRNSGFRRLRHRLKDPAFSKTFWTSILGTSALILIVLIVWDRFLRYPKLPTEQIPHTYPSAVE